jgi:transcriptional regulator with PAS, ATPase and Fis domain
MPVIPGKIMEFLQNYDWPGNVRELQSVIQRFLAVGNFDFLKLKGDEEEAVEDVFHPPEGEVVDLRAAREAFEKRLILSMLNKNAWHRGKVAAELGIDPKTLYLKMKKIGLC